MQNQKDESTRASIGKVWVKLKGLKLIEYLQMLYKLFLNYCNIAKMPETSAIFNNVVYFEV